MQTEEASRDERKIENRYDGAGRKQSNRTGSQKQDETQGTIIQYNKQTHETTLNKTL